MLQRALILVSIVVIQFIGLSPAQGQWQFGDPASDPLATSDIEWLFWKAEQAELDEAVPCDGSCAVGKVYVIDAEEERGTVVGESLLEESTMLGEEQTLYEEEEFVSEVDLEGDLDAALVLDDTWTADNGEVALSRADWDPEFRVIDLNASQYVLIRGPFQGQLQAGFKYALANQPIGTFSSKSFAAATPSGGIGLARQRMDMNAYGANLGLKGGLAVTRRVKLVGRFLYSPMIANYDQHVFYAVPEGGLAADTDYVPLSQESTRLVSVFDLRMGVEMSLYSSDVRETTLSFGYEFQNWVNHPAFVTGTNDSGAVLFDRHMGDFAFDGVSAAAIFRF